MIQLANGADDHRMEIGLIRMTLEEEFGLVQAQRKTSKKQVNIVKRTSGETQLDWTFEVNAMKKPINGLRYLLVCLII